MAVRLIAPSADGIQHYVLNIHADEAAQVVALVCVPRSGPTLRLEAREDDALDAALKLVGAVMRLRGSGEVD